MPGSKWELVEAPFVPLRNLVMFPGMTVPLIIGRERSVAAVEEAYANDRMIVVCTQKSEMVDEPGASDLYDVGVGCEILQLQQKMPDGNLRVIAEGIRRVKIKKFVDGEKFTKAVVEPFVETFEMDPEIKALMRVLTGKFDEYFRINKRLLPEMLLGLSEIEEPNQMADIVAANIGLSISEKQEVLSIVPVRERLSRLIDLVSSELEVLNIQNKIESEVRNKIDKTQKEFYLREQLKAIQKELGESSSEFSND
ncbi:MAG TPA: LON peptidase substrate-binding domain-containing protein, partial [Caldisericia bacterium]|nr:LON peptidase substrate-binding domain-containing protein [Caldisericia bacterium]